MSLVFAGVVGVTLVLGILVGLGLSRPVDDNTKDVLVAGIGGVLGFLTGLSVAAVGIRSSRATDSERFKREDRYRFAADKQAAYSRLLSAGDLARAAVFVAGGDAPGATLQRAGDRVDEMSAAEDVAALLGSSEVQVAARTYVELVLDFYNLTESISRLPVARRNAAVQDESDWDQAHLDVNDQREVVIRAMREDLAT
jgi:hypothetical protein